MKKGFLITIMWSLFLGAFAAACTDNKEKDPKPAPSETVPEWPSALSLEAIGDEVVSLPINPNMDWTLTLKNESGDYFWFVDGEAHTLTLSGNKGAHDVKIGVSNSNLDVTAKGSISITMDGTTKEFATITRIGLSDTYPALREENVYGSTPYDYVLALTQQWKVELYTTGGEDDKEYFWIEGENGEHLTELSGDAGAYHIYIGHADNDDDLTAKGTLILSIITDEDDENGAQESNPVLALTLPSVASLFPEEAQNVRKAAGETYEHEVDYPLDWTLTLSDTKTFYIEDGNSQLSKISGKGGEKTTVKFVAKDDSVEEGSASVSLTLGNITREVLTLTRPAIDKTIPSKKEIELLAGEKYTLELNTDSPFDISIPASALSYFGIENGNTTNDLSVHYDKGVHSINILARESTRSYDEDHECVVSMTMSNNTQEILVLKVKKLERKIKVFYDTFGEPGSAEFNDGRWLGQYTEVEDNVEFKFNRYQGDFFALRMKVEASLLWSIKDYPEWITEESILTRNTQDNNVIDLEIDPTKLNLDGDSGEIVFIDASDSSNPVEVGRCTVSYPSARNECYGYIGYYDAGHIATDAFDKTGMHMTDNGNEENASAVIVGTESAKAYIVGPDDSGKLVVSPSYSHIEYGAWDSTMPFQTRKFTYDFDANDGYNRTAHLYIFNGDAPADLISGDDVNPKYDAEKLSVITQLGAKGREDGIKLYIVSYSYLDFDADWNDDIIQCNEEEGVKRGIKYELLKEGSVAETVRKSTGVDDLEVWQVTYKVATYQNGVGWKYPIGKIASFTLSGYEGMAFEVKADTNLQEQLGITSPLKTEGTSNAQSTPTSYYITISPTDESAKSENIVLLYTGEESDEPLVALYIVYDPNAQF